MTVVPVAEMLVVHSEEETMRTRVVTALVLALVPAVLSAQAPDERIEAAMLRAQQAGIPVQMLESKVAEGKAKGASADRIAAAVEARLGGLERAHSAMARSGSVSDGDLALGADAVQAGVSEAVLGTLAETARGERRGAAIAALTELVELGHAPEHALERVMEALSKGPEALANLPAQAQQRQGQGPPVGVPAAGARGGVPATVPAPGQAPQGGKPGTPKPPTGGRPGGL
jgi:hypothetical protein